MSVLFDEAEGDVDPGQCCFFAIYNIYSKRLLYGTQARGSYSKVCYMDLVRKFSANKIFFRKSIFSKEIYKKEV